MEVKIEKNCAEPTDNEGLTLCNGNGLMTQKIPISYEDDETTSDLYPDIVSSHGKLFKSDEGAYIFQLGDMSMKNGYNRNLEIESSLNNYLPSPKSATSDPDIGSGNGYECKCADR